MKSASSRAGIAESCVTDPRSILIVKPSSLGDVIHTLPAVSCIRARWPQAKLRWLVNPEWAPILEGNPDIDEVIEFPRQRFRGLLGWLRLPGWIRQLRARAHSDLALDFQGLLRSATIARKAASVCWGTSDSREFARLFHHHAVPVPPRSEPFHAVRRYLALAAALGCDTSGPLTWRLPAGTKPAGCPDKFILLHPFSRGAGKSLNAEEVAAFCHEVAPNQVVLAGRTSLALPTLPNVVNLLNVTTLPELCWLLRNAAFAVSVDSGPMHIGAALSQNLLAIHMWSDPRKVGPFNPAAWVWKDGKIGTMDAFPNGSELPREEIGRWIAKKLAGSALSRPA